MYKKIIDIRSHFYIALLAVLFSILISCSSTEEAASPDIESAKLKITTSNPLVTDWVKNIDGDLNNEIINLIPYDSDAHHYQFTPKDFTNISESDVFFLIGEGYESASLIKFIEENNINHVELLSVVNPLEFDDHDDHSDHADHDDHEGHGDEDKHDDHEGHGDEDKHDDHEGHNHGQYDPHFWFDIDRVILATEKISQTMAGLDSNNQKSYTDNQVSYSKELSNLGTEMQAKIDNSNVAGIPFITMHEALAYLYTKYSLNYKGSVYAYNLEDLEITSSKYIELLDIINDSKANFLIVEDNVGEKMANSIVDETGIKLIKGMTVENMKSSSQSYIEWIDSNITTLIEGLSLK